MQSEQRYPHFKKSHHFLKYKICRSAIHLIFCCLKVLMTVATIEEWESKVLIQSGSSFLLHKHMKTSTISNLNKEIQLKHAIKVQTVNCAARFTICHRTLKFSANIHFNLKSTNEGNGTMGHRTMGSN